MAPVLAHCALEEASSVVLYSSLYGECVLAWPFGPLNRLKTDSENGFGLTEATNWRGNHSAVQGTKQWQAWTAAKKTVVVVLLQIVKPDQDCTAALRHRPLDESL